MKILIFVIIFKLIDFLISFLAPNFITQGFFPYRDLIESYRLPQFLTSFANFDGAHYISIANNGYAQYEQAFFPLYPLLIRILSPIFTKNHLLTGLIISNTAFFIGLLVFNRYLRNLFENCKLKIENYTILFLLTFPTSFFFGAVYTEGLFFLFTILTFYFLQKEKYLLAGIFGFFAALTRLAGVFLIIPIGIQIFKQFLLINPKSKVQISNQIRSPKFKLNKIYFLDFRLWISFVIRILSFGFKKFFNVWYFILPILGLSLYCLYLWQTTGDPLSFFHSQASFNLNRSTNLVLLPQVYYRYFKIFLTANHNFQYFISLFEFITFSFVFYVLILDLWKIIKKRSERSQPFTTRLGLNLFSLANLLIPTFTGTLLSIPRFALLSLSFFVFLAEIKNKPIKIIIAMIFVIFHIIFFSFFVRGYFVS